MPPKHDADAIHSFMQGLPSSLNLGGNRRRWPKWLFRSDHVENTATILNSGSLLSRAAAESANVIIKDSGSPGHVGELSAEHRRYVRLYFRPRTPTQFVNEGIRPSDKIRYDAHMPVPVYLLFSSSLLTETGVRFSLGRLTSTTKVGDSATFLKQMDFKDIYHNTSVGALGESQTRSRILNARHSEVLVKDQLSLDHLKRIVCRSGPERDTLLNLLDPAAAERWAKKVMVDDGRGMLFFRGGNFCQGSASFRTGIAIHVSSVSRSAVERPISSFGSEWTRNLWSRKHEDRNFTVSTAPLKLSIPSSEPLKDYRVQVQLNGDMALLGLFERNDFYEGLF